VSAWDRLLARPDGEWSADLPAVHAAAQVRRSVSPVKVGSIDPGAIRLLRSLCVELQPRVIAEIGTGLGASTFALQASQVLYTCDKNHDLVPSSDRVVTHPKSLSTPMLEAMLYRGLVVDLFFFDGRIQPADLPLIDKLSHATTAYVVDDYVRSERRAEKGLANLELLHPLLPDYVLIPPTRETWNPIAALLHPSSLTWQEAA
jgi:hypothetical protein